ncbi:hypothetical protein [Thalassotalea sp. G2M2-11]|uniref:hypothetical protein n=1 Tax=Thalassotalea sp. G2M2-11 TaxID=2787627 RepID=UPI0019D0DE4B|nr:hypothetical protein [Thalassotalea sp. G2M2-11]
MPRGNSRKVPLKEILLIDEITPRGPLGKGSKGRQKVLDKLTDDHRQALTSEAALKARVTPQGFSIGANIERLKVAKIPRDLPTAYEKKLKGVSYALVDGYQRYKAIVKKYGLETRVPIEELEGETMADLMLAAYEANEKHPLLLTQDEKKAHVFRLMLNGLLMDKSIDQLYKMFSHSFGRTTIAEYKNAAKFAREEAQLEGLPPEQVIAALREHLRAPTVDLINPRYDSKGYPLKETVVGWKSVVETGDVTELLAKREREEERRQSKEREALTDFAATAKGYDEKVALKAAYALIGRLKDKLNDKPDEDFLELFGED